MTHTTPRFNAPIPEYADLNFLFYRWGYDQLGENGLKLFERSIALHCDEGLLRFYGYLTLCDQLSTIPSDIKDLPDDFFEESKNLNEEDDDRGESRLIKWVQEAIEPPKFFKAYSNKKYENKNYGLTQEQLEQLGFVFIDDDDLPEFYWIYSLGFSDHDTVLIDSIDHEGEELISLERGLKIKHINGSYQTVHVYHYSEPEFSFENILCTRVGVKVFEQVTGFYNHGLSEEQIQEHLPKPLNETSKKRHSNLARVNQKRKLTDDDLLKTCSVYKQIQDKNPNWELTDLRETVGDSLGVSGQTVKNHIQKAIERGLIQES